MSPTSVFLSLTTNFNKHYYQETWKGYLRNMPEYAKVFINKAYGIWPKESKGIVPTIL